MWQKCPICNGTGMTAPNYQTSSATAVPCTVCNGAKIINDLTGLPPNAVSVKDFRTEPFYAPPYTPNNSGDFRDVGYETQQEYFGK